LYKQGKRSEALAAYREAIKLDPANADVHGDVGSVLLDQNQVEEAIAAFRRVIALDPRHVVARYNLGNVLMNQNKLDEAAALYRQVITLDPKHTMTRINLGAALYKQGKVDEATAFMREAIALDPSNAIGHYNLGNGLAEQGKLDEAIACYRRVIKIDPQYAEAHCNLGQMLRHQGRLTESLDCYRRGHELGSKRPGWPFPSALWVRQGERLVLQEKQLLDVLAGKRKPASALERVKYADLCGLTRRYHAGARLYAEAFAADATLAEDLQAGHRYNAARAAALASGGGQDDAPTKLDDQERARLRRQALDWLRADLAALGKQLESASPADRAAVSTRMQQWQKDDYLAGIRDPEPLAKLPAEQRQACAKLWADVEALRRKAQGKPAVK
jgi:cytochrome c-type biogenesis protein CcmH/NrfG